MSQVPFHCSAICLIGEGGHGPVCGECPRHSKGEGVGGQNEQEARADEWWVSLPLKE